MSRSCASAIREAIGASARDATAARTARSRCAASTTNSEPLTAGSSARSTSSARVRSVGLISAISVLPSVVLPLPYGTRVAARWTGHEIYVNSRGVPLAAPAGGVTVESVRVKALRLHAPTATSRSSGTVASSRSGTRARPLRSRRAAAARRISSRLWKSKRSSNTSGKAGLSTSARTTSAARSFARCSSTAGPAVGFPAMASRTSATRSCASVTINPKGRSNLPATTSRTTSFFDCA